MKHRSSTLVRSRELVKANESYQKVAEALDPVQAAKLFLEVVAFELAQQGLKGEDFIAFAKEANRRARHR